MKDVYRNWLDQMVVNGRYTKQANRISGAKKVVNNETTGSVREYLVGGNDRRRDRADRVARIGFQWGRFINSLRNSEWLDLWFCHDVLPVYWGRR